MEKQGRDPDITLIIGYPGCGKSTLCEKFIEKGLSLQKKCLIVRPNDRDWNHYEEIQNTDFHKMKGVKTLIYEKKVTLPEIIKKFYNGFLFFDDCRYYFRSNVENIEGLRQLLIDRRKMMTDVFFIAHGFSEIPPAVYTFAKRAILFSTQDSIASRKEVILKYNFVAKKQLEINEKAKENQYYFEIINL
jgi:GTPase SAR1 family protein